MVLPMACLKEEHLITTLDLAHILSFLSLECASFLWSPEPLPHSPVRICIVSDVDYQSADPNWFPLPSTFIWSQLSEGQIISLVK